MKKISFILLVFLAVGCGSSLKNSWSNFTAYYNTYYNAKQDFNAGLAQVKQQPVQFNPAEPVRPHPTPASAGVENFEAAIDNAAQILRRFPNSKWTDDALLLIGKSYYYLHEYFLARQKFEELFSLSIQKSLKQQAIIWKGRTLLDISSYSGGVQFLKEQLNDSTLNWEAHNRAETQILLAEHLTMLENWGEAARILETAIPHLEKSALKGRSYFLWGQLLERNNEFVIAYQAYSNVNRNFLDYEYVYWAEIKKATVSRQDGKIELAANIYNAMLKDDKNYERRNEIYYQLAQTHEAESRYKQAENTYKKVLANPGAGTTQNLRSDTYYQLGQLYSEQYNKYGLAAAYFDSSSTSSSSQSLQGAPVNATSLASAYSRYVSLKQEITRADSLLRLGSLNKEALKAELALIRQQRKETMKESQNVVQQTRNTLSNVQQRRDVYDTESSNPGTGAYGFLNYRNAQMMQEERREFTAVWGERPLVDNWRRREAITSTGIAESQSAAPSTPASVANEDDSLDDATLGIDLNAIPQTDEAKQKLQAARLNAEYRLGSLFFLTIDQPDSAAYYYQRVLEQSPPAQIEAQTLYSMHELYRLEDKPDSAEIYQNKILQSYPNSKYASRILDNTNGADTQKQNSTEQQDSTAILRTKAQKLLILDDLDEPSAERAENLCMLAVNNRTSPLAPSIYFEGIRELIQFAKRQDAVETYPLFLNNTILDSLFSGPYSSTDWIAVKVALSEFKELFPDAPQVQQVNIWLAMVNNPEKEQAILKCEDIGVQPRIIPSREAFMQSVSMPEKLQGMNLSGSLRYRLTIAKKGRVESYELLSNPTNLGIEEAFEEAIQNSLEFEPIMHNGEAVRISCEVEFQIQQ